MNMGRPLQASGTEAQRAARSLQLSLNLRVVPAWGHALTEANMNSQGSSPMFPAFRHLRGDGRALLIT